MSLSSVTAIHSRRSSIDDPQTELISTLRGQIQDLFTQVTQLNSKLVQSYDRVSDLEDDLHVNQSNLRQSTLKISQLELERTQHLSALNTGTLVERSNVVEELTRLMERATQEAAQRSSAESAKRNIETELEELAKDLFEGANGMVAEARYERFLSQQRAEESERRARDVEERLVAMQQEMRQLDKGKWVPSAGDLVKERKLMSSHVPYQEFLGFVGHLRGLHGQQGQAVPAMTTLLSLPFLARIATEDSDPTLRLDLAPSFNWLSRRSVLAAIHNGCLVIESVSTGFNLNNLSITVGAGGAGGNGTNHNTVACALCGVNIFPGPDAASPSSHSQPANQPTGTWPTSISLFRKGSSASLNTTQSSQGSQGITPPPSPPLPSKARTILGVDSHEIAQGQIMPEQVSRPSSSFQPSFVPPFSSQSSSTQPSSLTNTGMGFNGSASSAGTNTNTGTNTGSIYPLCTSAWCLTRLRATCEIWAFVRSGVVKKVWEEDVPSPHTHISTSGPAPPIPPRKRGLWGTLESLSERAVSWGGGSQSGSRPSTPIAEEKEKKLPVLPPPQPLVHPSVASIQQNPPSEDGAGASTGSGTSTTGAPPPLPKRSEGRGRQLSAPTALKPVVEVTSQVDTESPAHTSEANADLPEEDQEDPIHTVVFSASAHNTPIHSPTPAVAQEPSKFPLPDSRPSTPVVGGLSTDSRPGTPSNTNKPPSRPTTPSNPAGLVSSRPGTPSNRTDGVPPPLPRRAVTRGPRPMSTRKSSTSPGPPAIDVARTEVIKEEGEGDAVETKVVEKVEKEDQEEVIKGTNGVTEVAQPEGTVELKPSNAGVEGQIQREDNIDAETDIGNTSTSATTPEVEGTGGAEVADAGRMTAITTDKIETDHHAAKRGGETSESAEENGTETSLESGKPFPPYTSVGHSTWEERTWREIVRLKEVMFWARVGGVESS
ncbi:proline-rich protein [Lentinula lateritia]|nr:proline-rich protein [Lentinula lateritia]